VPPPFIVPFTKMNGAGNDFIVLDNRFLVFSDDELAALARRFCPRRVGVGADGLLALDEPREPGAHFRMRYRNADGSLGTMCGNGARCLARFAARAGLGDASPDGATALVFDTDGGRYRAEVPPDPAADVRLDVPPPRGFGPSGAADGARTVHRIWTGTEHAVVFSSDVAAEDLPALGPRLRHDAAFAPTGANVNVVEVAAPGGADEAARIVVRTFEKGVEAETLACGTGALASALVARLTGAVRAERVDVAMPGGMLRVGFALDGDDVRALTLAGPAETVYEGTLEWAV
jgi:diaminopimelate epimerase